MGLLGGSDDKGSVFNTRLEFSLGLEDPLEKEMAKPLQYSCLENPMT